MLKNLRLLLGLVAGLLSLTAVLPAEDAVPATAPEGPLLQAGDIDRIINNLPKIIQEFERLGAKWGDMQNPTQAQALQANEEVQALLKRYDLGGDGEFLAKVSAMAAAFGQAKMEQELANLPAEQRQMMQQMMQGQGLGGLQLAHPADVAKVKADLARVEKFFEEIDD